MHAKLIRIITLFKKVKLIKILNYYVLNVVNSPNKTYHILY